jgi:hypothetical protein
MEYQTTKPYTIESTKVADKLLEFGTSSVTSESRTAIDVENPDSIVTGIQIVQ